MGAARNVLPVLVDIARMAGQDLSSGRVRTVCGGPAALRVYTPAELGINGIYLGAGAASAWVDVAGYRSLTAFIRIEGVASNSANINLIATPVGPEDTWGTAEQYQATIATRASVNGPGNYLVANAGNQTIISGTSWTGCIARRVKIEVGPLGAGAQAWAYLLCLP
ncbi:MAG: hypothetical protein KatS3mg024_1809 [Armatimonadota bacterium]|nr:MAG: hypothetical protein KatS3mg024_1809 [Armatimonadota bacterium]